MVGCSRLFYIYIHANHYEFGVIFTLFNSNYVSTIIIAILRFLGYKYTQSTILNALSDSAGS